MKKNNDIRIDVKLLHPNLRHKLNKLLDACNKQGIYLIITEGYRTVADQNALYAQGRTKPGIIVTDATGTSYQSQHQWGIAFDIAINDNKLLYNVVYLTKVAKIAKADPINLCWGGDWTDIIDRPHFYLGNWGSTPKQLKELYITPDAFMKTWKAKVVRKGGLHIWSTYKLRNRKSKIKLDYGFEVDVLWRHKKWSKVNYNGLVGYMRSKYIK